MLINKYIYIFREVWHIHGCVHINIYKCISFQLENLPDTLLKVFYSLVWCSTKKVTDELQLKRRSILKNKN